MLTRPLTLTVWLAYGLLITGCAKPPPAIAPTLTLPEVVRQPCRLSFLPDSPTEADLEAGYADRGVAVALCDGKRDLAVQAFDAQSRALAPPPRPFWRFW
jgi:hypothetical protein